MTRDLSKASQPFVGITVVYACERPVSFHLFYVCDIEHAVVTAISELRSVSPLKWNTAFQVNSWITAFIRFKETCFMTD